MIRAFKGNYPVNNPFGVYDPIAYANYPGYLHPGTDYPLPRRTPLYAGMSGTLSRKLWGIRLRKGNEAIITNGAHERRYAHMDEITRPDGWVNEGELIGYSGNTGYVLPVPTPANPNNGSHLHDELLINGKYTSLEDYLKGDPMPDIKPTEAQVYEAFRRFANKEPANPEQVQYYMGRDIRDLYFDILNYEVIPKKEEVEQAFKDFSPVPINTPPYTDQTRYYTSYAGDLLYRDLAIGLKKQLDAAKPAPEKKYKQYSGAPLFLEDK